MSIGNLSTSTTRKSRTILDAIKEVLFEEGGPMSAANIYGSIIHHKLYEFKADDPYHVVRSQLRRHCIGLEFSTAAPTKYFEITKDGRFSLIAQGASRANAQNLSIRKNMNQAKSRDYDKAANSLRERHRIRLSHAEYLEKFKENTLIRILELDPYVFENFSRNLLLAYGFKDVQTTRRSKDGGIDGYGQLKVGLAHLNVAFQCKKWARGSVGRPDVASFRGEIQGKYELGIFFTTAKFSSEAKACSFQSGAVPVMLIDGPAIVEIMIEKNFGVETEILHLYSLALDEALAETPKPST